MAGTWQFPNYHTKCPDLSRQEAIGLPCLRVTGTMRKSARHYSTPLLKGWLSTHDAIHINRRVTPETKRRSMPHPQLTSDTVAHPEGQQRQRQSGGREACAAES